MYKRQGEHWRAEDVEVARQLAVRARPARGSAADRAAILLGLCALPLGARVL